MTEAREPLTILHVLAPAPAGGLESVVRALANGHRARGHRVVVAVAVDSAEHPFVRALATDGIDVRLFIVGGKDVRGERAVVARLLDTEQPHVLHTHGYRPDIIDLPVARRHRVPSVTTLHGFTGGDWKMRIYERLQLRALRAASAVVAVSNGVATRAERAGVPRQRIHRIPNAYAPTPLLDREAARAQLGITDTRSRVAWIGRMSHEKGADVMVEAFALLADLPIGLSFIGDGPDRARLEARALTLGVADRIHWHGLVPDAARLLSAFDGFVLSSRSEGTPMVVLEAMAAYVPIVATQVGGVPDMLTNAEAWLVPPEAPQALADAIRAMLTRTGDAQMDDAQARTRRAHARLLADFDMETWLARYEALYASIQRPASPRGTPR